jgi:hypothetical protein
MTDVSEMFTVSIIALIETVGISETSVSSYQTTRRNIPVDSHLQDTCHFPKSLFGLIGGSFDKIDVLCRFRRT